MCDRQTGIEIRQLLKLVATEDKHSVLEIDRHKEREGDVEHGHQMPQHSHAFTHTHTHAHHTYFEKWWEAAIETHPEVHGLRPHIPENTVVES